LPAVFRTAPTGLEAVARDTTAVAVAIGAETTLDREGDAAVEAADT
jgi:hypothetical protein